MGNSLSSISPLPRHQGRGQGGPGAWTIACLPYHPCPGLHPGETFRGSDPWPLMTEGCHTDCLVSENFLIFNCRADYF